MNAIERLIEWMDSIEKRDVSDPYDKGWDDCVSNCEEKAKQLLAKEQKPTAPSGLIEEIKEVCEDYKHITSNFGYIKIIEILSRYSPKPEVEELPKPYACETNPLHHSEKCPASKGGPMCTCGGYYDRTPFKPEVEPLAKLADRKGWFISRHDNSDGDRAWTGDKWTKRKGKWLLCISQERNGDGVEHFWGDTYESAESKAREFLNSLGDK